VKSNYAANATLGENAALALLAKAVSPPVLVFAFICECVDYGGHTHPPDSIRSGLNSPSRNHK